MQETPTTIGLLADVLRLLAVAAVGIFVGSMLTEGLVLVPFWQSLAPGDFLTWYAANDQRLLDYFAPLTVVAALLPLAAAVLSLWVGHPNRWYAVFAFVVMAVIVAMFPLYFQGVNQSFSTASIAPSDVAPALERWAAWHWVRTALSVAALVAALLALSRSDR
jgi:hypothetical protein